MLPSRMPVSATGGAAAPVCATAAGGAGGGTDIDAGGITMDIVAGTDMENPDGVWKYGACERAGVEGWTRPSGGDDAAACDTCGVLGKCPAGCDGLPAPPGPACAAELTVLGRDAAAVVAAAGGPPELTGGADMAAAATQRDAHTRRHMPAGDLGAMRRAVQGSNAHYGLYSTPGTMERWVHTPHGRVQLFAFPVARQCPAAPVMQGGSMRFFYIGQGGVNTEPLAAC